MPKQKIAVLKLEKSLQEKFIKLAKIASEETNFNVKWNNLALKVLREHAAFQEEVAIEEANSDIASKIRG